MKDEDLVQVTNTLPSVFLFPIIGPFVFSSLKITFVTFYNIV